MCDLTLKTAKQSFCTTFWRMVVHRHTKFGNKWFCDSEDIIRSDLDLETSIQYFHETLWLMMICRQTKFSCKIVLSLEDIVERVAL